MAYQMLEQQQAIASLTQKVETVQESSEIGVSQQDQNFSQDNNVISKKNSRKTRSKTPYSPTKIKARNFLTNIAYRRVNEKDLKDGSFVIDLLCYFTMDVKSFFLNSTYFEDESREMILMLWNECLPANYLNYLKKPENFELLHNPKLTFKNVKNLVKNYIASQNLFFELTQYMRKHHHMYQYVYSFLFSTYYTQSNEHGLKSKIMFTMCFDSWKKKKNGKNLGKNPFNFHVDGDVNPYGQRPLNDDEFRADIVDTKKTPLAEKENDIPTSKYPSASLNVSQRFVYAPTMANIKQFDKRYKLPKRYKLQKKSVGLSKEEKRQNKKEHLIQKLAENNEKMKIINKNKQC